MSSPEPPLVAPSDLASALAVGNTANFDVARAAALIADATTLCANYLAPTPLPATASVVVKRVAARAFVSTLSARREQMQDAGSLFGGILSGGTFLLDSDKADLDAAARAAAATVPGTSGAFSVDMLPVGYVAPISPIYDPLSGNGLGSAAST